MVFESHNAGSDSEVIPTSISSSQITSLKALLQSRSVCAAHWQTYSEDYKILVVPRWTYIHIRMYIPE